MIFARFEQKQKKGRAGPDLHCPGPDLICVDDGNFGPRGRWLRRKKRRAEAQLVADLIEKGTEKGWIKSSALVI
jgi:hypothetical protein